MSGKTAKKVRKEARKQLTEKFPQYASTLIDEKMRAEVTKLAKEMTKLRVKNLLRPKPALVPAFIWRVLQRAVLTIED